jgi:hypothetical protein
MDPSPERSIELFACQRADNKLDSLIEPSNYCGG